MDKNTKHKAQVTNWIPAGV